jgi:D-alanyl-D-alanine carboxypeptidase/D-alanyl-D-alanine-endopeptidase (penicillin-binding protein 4)
VEAPDSETKAVLVSRRSFAFCACAAVGAFARVARADDSLEPARAAAATALTELSSWARLHGLALSAVLLDAGSGQELGSAGAHSPLNPASNQKLLTMASALDRLGPGYRFTTALAGRESAPATLSELVLRSNGDPELSLSVLEKLTRALAEQGVRAIAGDIWVDQSAFDSAWEPPGYHEHADDWAAYRAPVSAVSVDGNALTLHVAPALEGEAARAWVSPVGVATIDGQIQSGASRGPQNVRLSVTEERDLPSAHVGGVIPSGHAEQTFSRRLPNPELAAGHVLRQLLLERGIACPGRVQSGGANIEAERASVRSRSLAEILHALGKHSDNFVAEMLLKALSRSEKGEPGSSAAGASLVEEYVTRVRSAEPGLRIGNGSGLYDANRVSAWTLGRVLVSAYQDPRIAPEFLAALSIGGVDGTLSQRFKAFRSRRTIRAKTGTLASVSALSGYVLRSWPNPPLVFSLLLNGSNTKQFEARQRMDAVVEAVARVA